MEDDALSTGSGTFPAYARVFADAVRQFGGACLIIVVHFSDSVALDAK